MALTAPSYLEHIRSPATSSSSPFHLSFIHHRAALFQADLIQYAVGLQGSGRDDSLLRNCFHGCQWCMRWLSRCQTPAAASFGFSHYNGRQIGRNITGIEKQGTEFQCGLSPD